MSVDEAKHRVERRRVQGSSFELPTLVFLGASRSLLVTEIYTQSPLARYSPIRRKLQTLYDVGRYFGPFDYGGNLRLVSGKHAVQPTRLPFLVHRSSSPGTSDYDLDWQSDRSKQRLDVPLRLASQVTKRLQRL